MWFGHEMMTILPLLLRNAFVAGVVRLLLRGDGRAGLGWERHVMTVPPLALLPRVEILHDRKERTTRYPSVLNALLHLLQVISQY